MSNVQCADEATILAANSDSVARGTQQGNELDHAKSVSANVSTIEGSAGSARTLLSQSQSAEPQYRRSLFRR